VSESPLPEPVLEEAERREFEKGLLEFNRGYFFECHDTLEELWSGIRGPSREFFQGLIQLSVGFYHLGNHNRGGALTMLRRGLARLARYPDDYGGFALGEVRRDVQGWIARIEQGEGFPESLDALPKYRWSPKDAR
jgi:predicted metal-dependent hydrolase